MLWTAYSPGPAPLSLVPQVGPFMDSLEEEEALLMYGDASAPITGSKSEASTTSGRCIAPLPSVTPKSSTSGGSAPNPLSKAATEAALASYAHIVCRSEKPKATQVKSTFQGGLNETGGAPPENFSLPMATNQLGLKSSDWATSVATGIECKANEPAYDD